MEADGAGGRCARVSDAALDFFSFFFPFHLSCSGDFTFFSRLSVRVDVIFFLDQFHIKMFITSIFNFGEKIESDRESLWEEE